MKNLLVLSSIGLFGGFIGGYIFIYFNGLSSADIYRPIVYTPAVNPVSDQKNWENIVSESSLALVGIQVFKSNNLIKQGSGIVVSSDGLIATVGDLAIAGAVYQVSYRDQLIRGKIVAVDYNLNLALIKTENNYSNVADLKDGRYLSGQEIMLIGQLTELSESTLFSQKGLISYATSKKIVIDTPASSSLLGAGVVNNEGGFIGLVYLKDGRANVIKGTLIADFFSINRNKTIK